MCPPAVAFPLYRGVNVSEKPLVSKLEENLLAAGATAPRILLGCKTTLAPVTVLSQEILIERNLKIARSPAQCWAEAHC